MGGVSEALALEGLPFTRSYKGQLIETAMTHSKIITGGARVIKSIISNLIGTYPTDDKVLDAMEAKIYQTVMNSYYKTKGVDQTAGLLSKEQDKEARDIVRSVLDTPAAEIPQGYNNVQVFKINGVEYRVPTENVPKFFEENVEENDVVIHIGGK